MTHTYAILDVSRAAFEEVARLLRAARYDHCFDRDVIDMHGIALRIGAEDATQARVNSGEGAGVLRDGALRRGGPGAAAVGPSGEDARAEAGGGEGEETRGGGDSGGGGGRGDAIGRRRARIDVDKFLAGRTGGPAAETPSDRTAGSSRTDDGGEPDGRWDDDGGASGTD